MTLTIRPEAAHRLIGGYPSRPRRRPPVRPGVLPGSGPGKLAQVEEIADFVVFLLSDRSGVVTGSVIDWDQKVAGAFD